MARIGEKIKCANKDCEIIFIKKYAGQKYHCKKCSKESGKRKQIEYIKRAIIKKAKAMGYVKGDVSER